MHPAIAIMSNEEFGVYVKLLAFVWLETFLPNDEKKLSRLVRVSPKKFAKLFASMRELFKIEDERITHPGLDELRETQRLWREKSSEGGRRSAEVRSKKGKGDSTTNQPNGNGGSTLHLQSAFASAPSTAIAPEEPTHTPASVCVPSKSKHPLETRRRYAIANNDSQDRPLGNGWIVSSGDGRFDGLIDEWLDNGALPAKQPESERSKNLRTSAEIFGWNEPDEFDRRPQA